MIDWNELARVDLKACCEFRSERFHRLVNEMWRDIVKDPDRDNEEIRSLWYNMCQGNPLVKREFLMFIVQTRSRYEQRPIDYKDVLRYMMYMSETELKEAEEIKKHSTKYH